MLFLLTVIFFWRPIFARQVLLPGGYLAGMRPWSTTVRMSVPQWNALQWDSLAEFYPWRLHYSRAMQHGIIPYWNPYQLSGIPFAANGQSAVFYPPNLLFVLFDPLTAFTVSAFIHLFLAGLFAYLLARRLGMGTQSSLVSGIIYAFSAFMVVWLELPTFVDVAAWLPLILLLSHLAIERKSPAIAAWSGAVMGICVLAGHLQIAFYCWLTAVLWWGWLIWSARKSREGFRSGLTCAAAAVVVALLVAAPQVLPTVELARMSHRTRALSAEGYARFAGNAVPSINLITMLVPGFFGNPSRGGYWMGNAAIFTETALYVGVASLFLALMGVLYAFKRRGAPAFFTVIAVGSLLVAFGTPLNMLFYYLIPGFSSLGGPNRIIVVYTLAAALLAGFGADWMAGACAGPDSPACEREGRLPVGSAAFALGGVTVLFAASWLLTGAKLEQLAGVSVADAARVRARPDLLVFTMLFAVCSLLLFLRANGALNRRTFLTAIIVLIAGDLLVFGSGYSPTSSREAVFPATPGIRALQRIAGTDRVAFINSKWSLYETPNAFFPPNAAMAYGLHDVGGYDSLFPRYRKERIDDLLGEDSSPVENGNMVLIKAYNPGLKDVADVFVSAEPIRDSSLREEYRGEFYVYRKAAKVSGHAGTTVNPNRLPVGTTADDVGGDTAWKLRRGVYRYEPDSIRLGLFLLLTGAAVVSSLSAYEIAVRRRAW